MNVRLLLMHLKHRALMMRDFLRDILSKTQTCIFGNLANNAGPDPDIFCQGWGVGDGEGLSVPF